MADSVNEVDISSEESSNISDYSASTDSESVDLSGEEFKRILVGGAVKGYQFGPYSGGEDSSSESGTDEHNSDEEEDANLAKWKKRMHTTSWCECKNCLNSTVPEENACCREKVPVNNVVDEYAADFEEIDCITDHPAFRSNCLDVWSLQLAYRLYHKKEVPGTMNQKYRYVAYRQMVRWVWKILGEGNRVPLPASS
ncbi:uncharacterized protein LOC135489543 [Lineus longissimus]|uniref:uncharacterized protein LOC135489543 n=1 Tax=Lineus longissimus TaxID=88925 RepID=UPI00315DC8DB